MMDSINEENNNIIAVNDKGIGAVSFMLGYKALCIMALVERCLLLITVGIIFTLIGLIVVNSGAIFVVLAVVMLCIPYILIALGGCIIFAHLTNGLLNFIANKWSGGSNFIREQRAGHKYRKEQGFPHYAILLLVTALIFLVAGITFLFVPMLAIELELIIVAVGWFLFIGVLGLNLVYTPYRSFVGADKLSSNYINFIHHNSEILDHNSSIILDSVVGGHLFVREDKGVVSILKQGSRYFILIEEHLNKIDADGNFSCYLNLYDVEIRLDNGIAYITKINYKESDNRAYNRLINDRFSNEYFYSLKHYSREVSAEEAMAIKDSINSDIMLLSRNDNGITLEDLGVEDRADQLCKLNFSREDGGVTAVSWCMSKLEKAGYNVAIYENSRRWNHCNG